MSRTDPLTWHVPITDKDGRPTPEFMKKWNQQAAINGAVPALATKPEVSAVLDVLSAAPNSLLLRGAATWDALTAPGAATKFLNGAAPPAWAQVKDSDLSTSDVTTNDVSTLKHGFAPKLPNDSAKYLDGTGAWSTPAGGGGSGRNAPVLVQGPATLRNDGTIALPSAPTVGNLMVLLTAGYYGSLGSYVPAGFNMVANYINGTSNMVLAWTRRVVAGDTGSYALTASDNQAAVLYEYSNCADVVGISGGAMIAFSGGAFHIGTLLNPFQDNAGGFVVVEADSTPTPVFTAATGLTVDYTTPTSATVNHQSSFARFGTGNPTLVQGTSTATLTTPVYGAYALVGT
jgi:hypothetical protein